MAYVPHLFTNKIFAKKVSLASFQELLKAEKLYFSLAKQHFFWSENFALPLRRKIFTNQFYNKEVFDLGSHPPTSPLMGHNI